MTAPKNDVVGQAKQFATARLADFKTFTPGQKAVSIVAVLALVIGGYVLLTWQSSPTYSPLYSNLAASDASSIVSKLQSENIPYQLSNGGATISVPASKVDAARLDVSAAGLPNSGNTGYALLDKEGVTTSQFQQQVDYQRAVEGELANTIQSISGVQSAQVHLAIPTATVFTDSSSQPTAAVLLNVASGTQLTAEQIKSVVYLVSSSVPGMKASNVTVTDSNGDLLSAAGSGTTALGGSTQAQATQAYDARVASQIQALVDATVGAGNAQVVVNAALNYSSSKTNLKQYVYNAKNPPTSITKTEEKFTGTNAGSGGTLGTTTTSSASGTASPGTYDNKSETVNNALGTLSTTTSTPPGSLQNLHVAVVLNKNVSGVTAASLAALTTAIKSGIGYNAKRGDTFAVNAVGFNNSAQSAANAAAKQAAAAAASAKSHAQLMSYIKQGIFAIVLLALVVGTWLASRKRRGGAGRPADSDPDLIDDLLGPHSVEATERREVPKHIGPINERRTVVLDAVDKTPADVAQVLSGWLNTKER